MKFCSCEWFWMFQGARALKTLKGKRQGFLKVDDVTINAKRKTVRNPMKDRSLLLTCTWSRAEVLKIEPKCLFVYINTFCSSTEEGNSEMLGYFASYSHSLLQHGDISESCEDKMRQPSCLLYKDASFPVLEDFFSIGESISYLHFMFGDVEVLKIFGDASRRWDQSFQISASIRTYPFLLNLWGRGEVGFFEVLDT